MVLERTEQEKEKNQNNENIDLITQQNKTKKTKPAQKYILLLFQSIGTILIAAKMILSSGVEPEAVNSSRDFCSTWNN